MKFFRDLFTEDDGKTFCAGRVCAVACVLTFITVTLIHVVNKNPVDFQQLGLGFTGVLIGAGAFIGIKAATQKDN